MTFQDKQLTCTKCERPFVFTAGEQEFYAAKNLTNEPKRCPSCRLANRLEKQGKDPGYRAEVACDICGAIAAVPFKPSGVRPIFCAPCHQKQKSQKTELIDDN